MTRDDKLAIDGGAPLRSAPMPARRAIGEAERAALLEALDYYDQRGLDPGYEGFFEQRYCRAFSELMGPLNLLHEPLALSSIELTFWALAATSEALAIVLLSPPLGAKAGLERGSLTPPTLPSPASGC